MNDHNDIERALGDLQFEIPQQVDERILNDGLQALDESFNKTTVDVSDKPSNNGSIIAPASVSRSGILRGPWRKAAAATIPAAAAVLIFIFLNARSSITLADVIAAVAEQAWVHLKYDNGRERWVSLHDGRRFYKHEQLRSVDYFDYDRGVRRIYMGSGDQKKIYQSRLEPEEKPTNAWDATLGWYERAAGKNKRGIEVEKHFEKVEGQRLVRFDTYYTDVQGQRILAGQIWADPKTRLPLRTRERLQWYEREEQKREWITGKYEFPPTGPTSLYDLGVPKDTEIVLWEKIPLTPEAQKIMEAVKQA
ncbi:MAG: hypothetical protein ACYTBZ_14035, partial [Planctomycetota bacterium]